MATESHIEFPARLKDGAAPGAELLRAVPSKPALSPQALQRIAGRLEAAGAGRPALLRRAGFAFAALGIALPVAATAAFVAWPAWERHFAITPQVQQAPAGSPPKRRVPPSPAVAPTAELPPTPVANAPLPAPAPPRVAPSVPATSFPHLARPSAPAPVPSAAPPIPAIDLPSPVASAAGAPAPSALAEQAEWLQRAMRQLHREHDAAGALRSLAAFEAAFPSSPLLLDARAAQVDADLALDREEDALTVLDRFAETGFASVPRAAGLRALRGELLARDGRCSDAIGAFAPVLDSADPAVRERALYGDAMCRVQLGDAAAGRAALTRYLNAFPNGVHAAQATAALAGKR